MAYTPFAQENGAIYTITSPTGAVAVLNNPASGNYAGMLQEITGLDSADVRESATELVEADGGAHGRFYFGRRPLTMLVKVFNHETALIRATRIDRLHRACQALRSDAILSWAPTYAPTVGMQVPVRLQQPIRDTGAWTKEVQLALVSASAVITSSTLNTSGTIASGGGGSVENRGSYPAYPVVTITGIATNPQVSDGHGGTLRMGPTGYTLSLASDESVAIDCLNHTAVFTAGARNGQSANRYIDFGLTTVWPNLVTGNNNFTLSGGGTVSVSWRDAWH